MHCVWKFGALYEHYGPSYVNHFPSWTCQTQKLDLPNTEIGLLNHITNNKKRFYTQRIPSLTSHTNHWRVLPSAVLFSPISSFFLDDLQQQFQQNLNLIWSQKNEINERIAYFKCFLFQLLYYEIINFVHYTNDRKLKCKTNKIKCIGLLIFLKDYFMISRFKHIYKLGLIQQFIAWISKKILLIITISLNFK